MNRKGRSPDNSACEGFLDRLKNEMHYSHDQRGMTVAESKKTSARYIEWYNTARIKRSLGSKTQTSTAVHRARQPKTGKHDNMPKFPTAPLTFR